MFQRLYKKLFPSVIRFKFGQRIGEWALKNRVSAVCSGVQYAAFLHEQKRHHPADSPIRQRAYQLMLRHHSANVKAGTDLYHLREKYIKISKELSQLKRMTGDLAGP